VSTIRLIKAHAYGNDFLMVPQADVASRDASDVARHVCDRHRGVGADGLMVLSEADGTTRMHLLNADGSPSEISGNGLRCVAAWLASRDRLGVGSEIAIDTDAGTKRLQLLEVTGPRVTFVAEMGAPTELREETVTVGDHAIRVVVLRVGNPQCVVLGPATPERLHTIAAALAVHPFFPAGTNVELADVISPSEVRILIWERGVGPTESSGTGACAAAVAAAAYGGANRQVDVVSPGGRQHVEWGPTGIRLTGWAEIIAEVEWRG
jgi:diaminopimelate epimerase